MRKRKITFEQLPSILSEIMDRLNAIESILREKKLASTSTTQEAPARDGTIDADAASKLIGRTKVTLYNLAKSGKIPAYKQGKNWHFAEADLQAWLQKPKGPRGRKAKSAATATGQPKTRGRRKKIVES